MGPSRPPSRSVRIAGVDEAGRGPLAGPVIAAAAILDRSAPISGLADSKCLKACQRESLAAQIKAQALAWGLGSASAAEIDAVNILQASLLAMARAVAALAIAPDTVLVDGLHCPGLPCRVKAIVGGDRTVAAISAASILAKVARDREMLRLDAIYPGYGFATHKGYPTPAHRLALSELGPCAIHRRSFRPVRECVPAVHDAR